MAQIKFSTGVEEYVLNDKVSVWFNPTDTLFITKLYDAFTAMDKLQEEYGKKISGSTDAGEILRIVGEADQEIRSIIDKCFEKEICKDLFAGISTYAMSDGMPIWANFMLAVLDEVDASYVTEKQKTNPRLAKYVNKYKK